MLFSKESSRWPLNAPAMVGTGRDGGGRREKDACLRCVAQPDLGSVPTMAGRAAARDARACGGAKFISARALLVQSQSAKRRSQGYLKPLFRLIGALE